MYIWNALTGWICCRCCCGRGQSEVAAANESTPLLSGGQNNGPSLTSGYTDFLHSNNALKLFAFHAVIYYAAAVIVFSYVLDTKWSIIDSLYFATVLFTTIGYGDLFPEHDVGRICTMLLASYGIVILGIFLGIYGESLLDYHTSEETETQATVRKTIVKTAKEALSDTATSAPTQAAVDTKTRASTSAETKPDGAGRSVSFDLEERDTTRRQSLTSAVQETKKSSPAVGCYGLVSDICYFFYDELPILTLVAGIGIGLGHLEGWSIIKSVYWTVITGTTVGLGDEAPQNEYVRLASLVFLPLSVAVLGEVLSRIANIYLARKRHKSQEEFFSRALTMADLEIMDTDKDGEVDKAEFLGYMLVALQMVEQEEVDEILALFKTLDRDGSGTLRQNDLQELNWGESVAQSICDVAVESLQEDTAVSRRASLRMSMSPQSSSPTSGRLGDYAPRWVNHVHVPGPPAVRPILPLQSPN